MGDSANRKSNSAGVFFHIDPNGEAQRSSAQHSRRSFRQRHFAVTIEPAGGESSPTGLRASRLCTVNPNFVRSEIYFLLAGNFALRCAFSKISSAAPNSSAVVSLKNFHFFPSLLSVAFAIFAHDGIGVRRMHASPGCARENCFPRCTRMPNASDSHAHQASAEFRRRASCTSVAFLRKCAKIGDASFQFYFTIDFPNVAVTLAYVRGLLRRYSPASQRHDGTCSTQLSPADRRIIVRSHHHVVHRNHPGALRQLVVTFSMRRPRDNDCNPHTERNGINAHLIRSNQTCCRTCRVNVVEHFRQLVFIFA